MVSNAETLLDVRLLRCLKLRIEEPASLGGVFGVSVWYMEVRLKGTLVNRQGAPLLVRPVSNASHWMGQVDSLGISTISVPERRARKVTG
jgi:hypothetical protein